jgi:hypothetical protein
MDHLERAKELIEEAEGIDRTKPGGRNEFTQKMFLLEAHCQIAQVEATRGVGVVLDRLDEKLQGFANYGVQVETKIK